MFSPHDIHLSLIALLLASQCQGIDPRHSAVRESGFEGLRLLQTVLQQRAHRRPTWNMTEIKLSTLFHWSDSVQGAHVVHLAKEAPHAQPLNSSSTRLLPIVCGSVLAVLAVLLVCSLSRVAQVLREEVFIRHSYGEAALEALPEDGGQNQYKKVATVVFYGVLYIVCSATLIKYNKYLVSKNRFPFALNLALGHQVSGSVFLLTLHTFRPSLFPSLADSSKRAACLSFRFLARAAMPIVICFSIQLALSNYAYLYASVAFLQMMKEGGVAVVYAISLASGLEPFRISHTHVLTCLILSTMLTIEGELSFSLIGFLIQGTSQFVEATKVVVQALLLSGSGTHKLDPLSYNLLIQPLSGAVIAVFVLISMNFIPGIYTASWADYALWWPHLLGNACMALLLNLTVAQFMSKTSGVGYAATGILKDIVLVLADVVITGTQVSRLQVGAFTLQIVFVCTYSFLKLYDKQLEGHDRKSKIIS